MADAQAQVTKARKAVRGAVQKAVGKKAKATGTTRRKAATRAKKTFTAKNAVTRKTVSSRRRGAKAAARTGAREVSRKTKR